MKPPKIQLFGLGAVYIAVAQMIAGNGLQTILLLSRASVAGFSTATIALMTSFYYSGWVLGCLVVPKILVGIGHTRVFTALASIASSIVILHALFVHEAVWVCLRLLSGFCLAGLFLIVESWLSEMAPAGGRVRAFSIYRVIDFSATITGQFLLLTAEIGHFALYGLISILISLSLVPVALSRAQSPAVPDLVGLKLKSLFVNSPQALMGCLVSGLCYGAYWGFTPTAVISITGSVTSIPIFIAAFLLGGFISQWAVGIVADKFDTRMVLTLATVLGAFVFGGCSLIVLSHPELYVVCSFLAGFCLLPIYSLCVSHANDRAEKLSFIEVSSGLLIGYGIGAATGPVVMGMLFSSIPKLGIFLFPAVALLTLAIFSISRTVTTDPVPIEDQSDYVPINRTIVNFKFDPRAKLDPKKSRTPID